MAEALAAWTDGTTLTMLDDATNDAAYKASKTYEITGTRTLDLAGHTLTWDAASLLTGSSYIDRVISVGQDASLSIIGGGVLDFSCKNGSAYAIYTDVKAKKLSIGAVSIKAAFDANNRTSGECYAIYCARETNCELSVIGTTIDIRGFVKGALYVGSKGNNSVEPTLSDITITGQDITKIVNTGIYGVAACRDVNLENCVISFNKEKKEVKCTGLYMANAASGTISGAKTSFVMNDNTGSAAIDIAVTGTSAVINNGVFVAPVAINVSSYDFTIKTNISADAKFKNEPWANAAPEGKIFTQIGGDGEYKDYYCVADGAYRFSDGQLGYMSAEECLEAIRKKASKQPFTVLTATEKNDFTSDLNIILVEKADKMYNGTITNRGTISFKEWYSSEMRQWDNMTIVNYGTINLAKNNYYLDGFVLDNRGGTINIPENCYFTDKSLEQVAAFITSAYTTTKDGAYWRVLKGSDIVAKVGETEYTDLGEALKNSSENAHATLTKDKSISSLALGANKDMYLDLGKHTLTMNMVMGAQLCGSKLTITNGTIKCKSKLAFNMVGSVNSTDKDYSVLIIGNDVTVNNTYTTDDKGYFVAVDDVDKPYGIVVNFSGTYNGQCPFYINGNLKTISDNAPTFNIGKDAEIYANSVAYAAGYGIWNYEGTATTSHHGFELRAGKLNVTGGKIVCTSDAPADDELNGSGSTSQASAIAAMQHSTKLPVEINISGGEFEAYTPLYQANPMNNPQEAYDKVKVTVTGGKFKATKGSKNVVWSENKKIALEGGVYNMNPSAYAANGKVAVENTDETTKADYPWMIDNVKAGITFQTAGEWSTAANWSGNAVATGETPVTVAANVTITGKAEAYGISVNADNTITIQKGGVLVVGKNGIAGITSADQLIIEDGGALVISPAATTNNQPQATVVRTMNTQKKTGTIEEGESPYVRYYMGIPTIDKPAINSNGIQLYARDWDAAIGWKDATEFKTTFKGYGVTSEELNEQATFAGQLIGNADATLAMPRRGFHFFANGWMASMDMYEVLNQLDQLKNNGFVEAAVTVCIAEGQYQTLTRAQLNLYPDWEQVSPLTTYFLHANKAATVTINYEKAAWNVQLAKKSAAPKRMMAAEEETNAVRIMLTAANGRQDNVYLYDGEEFHATKMMNTKPNVNIFVEDGQNNYSTFASEDLEGTVIGIQTNSQTNYSLAFDFVKGETLYIKDLQTGVVTAMIEGAVYNFVATANETSHRFIISRHNAPTAIDEVMVNTAVKGVYSITGQYLGESSVLETLPQGIYVVDGQKYIK